MWIPEGVALIRGQRSNKDRHLLEEIQFFAIRFNVLLLTTFNPRKQKSDKRVPLLSILIYTTTNVPHVYCVNIASYETLEKIEISLKRNTIKETEFPF